MRWERQSAGVLRDEPVRMRMYQGHRGAGHPESFEAAEDAEMPRMLEISRSFAASEVLLDPKTPLLSEPGNRVCLEARTPKPRLR